MSGPDSHLLKGKWDNSGIVNWQGGGEITYYETMSGGAVFSVGSIAYVTGLHTDTPLSTVTANVVSRFLGK